MRILLRRKLRVLGNQRGRLVTRLGDFLWTRAPLGTIGYPVDAFRVNSGTFGRDWLPGWGISYGLGYHSAGLVTLLMDFRRIRSPFGRIGYPVDGYPVDSGTFGRDWLPGWDISCEFGHHSEELVTRLGHFLWTRAPFRGIDYPVGAFPMDSGTFGLD